MPENLTARCNKCGRPKSVGDKASLTQWIVSCNCIEGAPAPPAQEPVDLCSKCGKRISGGRAGSFTQWVFRSDLCNCEVPEAMRPSVDLIEQQLPEFVEVDEDAELDLEGEPPFPLDRYGPIMELGKGASGHVYLCKDRLLQKKVAIKCLWAVTPEQLIGFQREAKATSLLSHPGVVSVLDFGLAAGDRGAPYMVMEYVEGTSLFDYISEHGPPPIDLGLRVIESVAEALGHAHERGIFHRDVKSSNILLCGPSLGGQTEVFNVRVIDFGVAGVKQAIQTPSADQGHTIVGTPAYMSPDQAQGLAYDQRSEVYSLGCVMYETLTGLLPFKCDTALETISKHAHEPAPALVDSDCGRSFSPELESLVARCLEKSPTDRFQSMNELIEAIREVDRGRLERAVPEVTERPQTAAGNTKFKPMAITGGIIIALGAITLFTLNVVNPGSLRHVKLLFSSSSEAESQKLSAEANSELEKNNFAKAIELSNSALSLDEENLRALDTRGVAYFLTGDTKRALADLNRVIKNSDKDAITGGSARFHRNVVYVSLGKKVSSKTLIPSSNSTYVPSQWEAKTFSPWTKQDWRLLPLSAPAQVGGDPAGWPKDLESYPLSKARLPGASAAQQSKFDSGMKAMLGKELGSDDGSKPSSGPHPDSGEGALKRNDTTLMQSSSQKFNSEFFPGSELGPGLADEVDEFNGINNFAYDTPTKVKVSTLASNKDIDKIIADRKIQSLTFTRVPISPAVLARIRVLPLRALVLQDYRATDKDLEFIGDFKFLDHFSLSLGLGTGTFISNLPKDTMVDLVLRKMKNLDLAGLERIKKLRHLKTLEINSCEKIGNSAIQIALEMPLERLIFTPRFNKNPLYHNKRYELAVMPNSKLDFYDVGDLKKIIAKPTLKKLVLDSDGLRDATYDDLSKATVHELILQGEKHIKPENLKKVAKNTYVKNFFLCGDVIDQNSAAALTGFQHLRAIFLFHTDMSKKVFDAMSKLRATDIVIVTDQLNSETVQNLAALKSIRRMKIVDQTAKLTDYDINRLREKLPTCKISLKDQR